MELMKNFQLFVVLLLTILSRKVLVIGLKQTNGCDLFEGSWIENEMYTNTIPLYNASNCPFMTFDCLKNGRNDTDYLNFRWKPNACDLPRFKGEDFLERNRGKKIMFVGDSLSNNMWQSLACMLHSAVPNSNYTLITSKSLSTILFQEYGVSIMFLKNGFLVDLVHEDIGIVLKLDSISSGDHWKGVDMLIFNTFHWWVHTGSSKTGSEWGEPKAKNCLKQTQPVMGSKYPGPPNSGEVIVKEVLNLVGEKVELLDITLLTQLRKDGHPSIYAGKGSQYVDCSHWCLPGVPDAWNELLYAILLQNQKFLLD